MKTFEERFNKVEQKDIPQLMEDIEHVFKIPYLTDEQFNKHNPKIIKDK